MLSDKTQRGIEYERGRAAPYIYFGSSKPPLSDVGWQWYYREIEQDRRNAQRKSAWATKLYFIR